MASEFSKVRVDMATGFGQVATEFSKVRVEMATGFGQVAGEFGRVRTETQAVKADLMRWVLLTLVSSAAITAAVTPTRERIHELESATTEAGSLNARAGS